MLVTLRQALRTGRPVLSIGELAMWEADPGQFIPVIYLGFGEYDSISSTSGSGPKTEGVTIKVTASRDTTSGRVKRGTMLCVPDAKVYPRTLVKLRTVEDERRFVHNGDSWAIDKTCRVHGEIHSAPQQVCKRGDIDNLIHNAVMAARRERREITHGAALEIAKWWAPDHPFTLTGVITDPDHVSHWHDLGGLTVSGKHPMRRAAWVHAAYSALRVYLTVHSKPRPAVEGWRDMEIDPLSYSGYGVYPTKPDNADDVGPWSAHTVRFRESTIATAPDRWVAWRLAYRHYEAWAHPHIAPACDIDGMPLAWSFRFEHLAAGITGDDHV